MGTPSAPAPVQASVTITAQNSCPRVLVVQSSALTSGSWSEGAQPVPGAQVAPGRTGSWLASTTTVNTPVAGTLDWAVAQAGRLVLGWDLTLSTPFRPTLTKQSWTADDVGAALVVNQGDYVNVWVQVLLSVVVTVRTGQTLRGIAAATDSRPSTMIAINALTAGAVTPGQRLLVTGDFPVGSVTADSYIVRCP